MRKILILIIVVLPLLLTAENISPIGKWKTIDDESGEPKSIILIWEESGLLYGKIEFLFLEEDEDPDPVCDKCTDENKDQPILGMVIMKDFKQSGSKWKGGTILDPDNGKIYKCNIELIDNGNKLKVRGFIGISLLGRTQYWEKFE